MKFTASQFKKYDRQIQDIESLLQLLNENKHSNISMRFSNADCGRANIDNGKFSIPLHAFTKGETYLHYYVIHEFTHCLGCWNHGSDFKRVEGQLLKLFGIEIEYKKAYPKKLYANGELSYTSK